MTVCRTNLEDVPKLVDLAEQVGAKHLEYRHLNAGGNHTAKTVDGWDWVYAEEEKFEDADYHDDLIFEAYQRAKSRGIGVTFMGAPFIGPFANEVEASVLRDLASYERLGFPDDRTWFSPKRLTSGSNGHTCPGPWWQIVVQPEGDVRYCYYHDITRFKIGNLLKSDIMAIWNSKEIIAERRQTLENAFSKACLSSGTCHARGRI